MEGISHHRVFHQLKRFRISGRNLLAIGQTHFQMIRVHAEYLALPLAVDGDMTAVRQPLKASFAGAVLVVNAEHPGARLISHIRLEDNHRGHALAGRTRQNPLIRPRPLHRLPCIIDYRCIPAHDRAHHHVISFLAGRRTAAEYSEQTQQKKTIQHDEKSEKTTAAHNRKKPLPCKYQKGHILL